MIERLNTNTDLFSYAYFGTPSWDLSLDYLAQMAEPENWLLKNEDGG